MIAVRRRAERTRASVGGAGLDQGPVRVGAGGVTREGPDVDHLLRGPGIALEELTVGVLEQIDLLALEADGDARPAAFHLRADDLRRRNGGQLGLERLPGRLTLIDRAVEA